MLLPLVLALICAGQMLSMAAPVMDATSSEAIAEPDQLDAVSAYLTRLLVEGWPEGESPVVYIEDGDAEAGDQQTLWKRSRYYRRYPWKRQNGRYQLAEDPHLCHPTREDVFQLLVALHEARRGDSGRFVSFCNRRRPASAIFTNIRFLGRK